MVGLVENALIEIRDRFRPDRIIIESSGSAFPATLALQIRQLEPQGFKLDGVVTVIDCQNFRGYEDTSPSAKVGSEALPEHTSSIDTATSQVYRPTAPFKAPACL